jgi:hypothetical protein
MQALKQKLQLILDIKVRNLTLILSRNRIKIYDKKKQLD